MGDCVVPLFDDASDANSLVAFRQIPNFEEDNGKALAFEFVYSVF
jgi:hypothetical protein